MEQIWKQFAAWAIASDHRVFFWARLKLTGIYVIIVAVIVIGFSAFLYQSLGQNLGDTVEGDFASPESQQHFVDRTLSSLENDLLLVDIIIIVCAGALGYALSGYTLRPIQHALEAQQAFSENASHELRTPIAVMKNDAEVLLRNPHASKELIHSTLKSNIEEMDRMAKMTEDLLLLARSQNRSEAFFDKINVTDIARHSIEKLRPLAERKGVALEMSYSDSFSINGSKTGMERILINLLQNALEHTPKGGSVRLKTARSGTNGSITIADSGSGIDEKDLPRVFERFYKGNGGGGNGLGLSIVKELVDQHGGKIDLDSLKGLGTTLTVSLPIAT